MRLRTTEKDIMSRLAKTVLIAASVLVLVNPAKSSVVSAAGELSVFVDGVDSEEFPLITAHLVVIDEKGLPIVGIPPESMAIAEDGKAVPGSSISPLVAAQEPLAVTLVVDTSISMEGKPLDDARIAAMNFVDEIGPHDMAAIIAFAGEVFPISDFTSDKEVLKNALASLAVGPNTALFDAVAASVEVTRREAVGRRVIVLLTDGEDNGSKRSLEVAIKAAEEARIPIFTIGLGKSVDRRVLERIATSTGGRSLYAPSSVDLQLAYQALASQLKSRYVLRMHSQLPADDQQHVMTITVNHQGRKAEARAQFSATPHPPRIVFLNPRESILSGKSTVIEVLVESAAPIARVQFSIDDETISEVLSEPFRFVWYTDTLEPGGHSIGVTAIDAAGNSSTEKKEVSFSVPEAPVAEVVITEPISTPTADPPTQNSLSWHFFAPIPATGLLVIGLQVITGRRKRVSTGSKPRSFPWMRVLSRPICPICGKRYSPSKGCASCTAEEEAAISARLSQIFRDDLTQPQRQRHQRHR